MKHKKRIVITTVLLLTLVPTIAFAALQWRGSESVTNTKNNLTLIQQKITRLENEKGNHSTELREIQILLEREQGLREQRERELQDKQKEIENKTAELREKDTVIQTKNQELEQALRDVQEIERITNEMVK